jgi:SAM-dependent methyltransferase
MQADDAGLFSELKPASLPVQLSTYQRRKMYQRFLDCFGLPDPEVTILDIGVTSDQTLESSNYLEAWYPLKDRITAAGIDDASFLETLYPGVRFIFADALNLLMTNQSFDLVHSSAVIEHVGSYTNQIAMIRECARVARRGLFVATPNRWFPVEFHTVLPIVHWLPKSLFRGLLRGIGKPFFAEEANLNLMTAGELLCAAKTAAGDTFDFHVEREKLAGWSSNLLLIGKRRISPTGEHLQ